MAIYKYIYLPWFQLVDHQKEFFLMIHLVKPR